MNSQSTILHAEMQGSNQKFMLGMKSTPPHGHIYCRVIFEQNQGHFHFVQKKPGYYHIWIIRKIYEITTCASANARSHYQSGFQGSIVPPMTLAEAQVVIYLSFG